MVFAQIVRKNYIRKYIVRQSEREGEMNCYVATVMSSANSCAGRGLLK